MYTTEIIWWSYTFFMVVVALFLIYFVSKVRQKGG